MIIKTQNERMIKMKRNLALLLIIAQLLTSTVGSFASENSANPKIFALLFTEYCEALLNDGVLLITILAESILEEIKSGNMEQAVVMLSFFNTEEKIPLPTEEAMIIYIAYTKGALSVGDIGAIIQYRFDNFNLSDYIK